MTDHDLTRRPPEDEPEPRGPRKVKVTDKRRVTPEGTERVPDGPAGPADSAAHPATEAGGAPAEGTTGAESHAAEARAAEYLEDLQRLQAEFANYRKRVLREQTRAVELASEPLVRRLLEVLDEFDLALMAADKQPDFDRFLHGVELVYAKLQDILRAEGLERIEADGKPFDPQKHEALMHSGGEGDGEPVVADVLRQGYTLNGHVIRPAGVRVGRKHE
jgi:molecular chaperone GrpE